MYTITEIRDIVAPIAARYGVERMTLFGSYARGEADEKSDIDLLMDKGRLRGILRYNAMLAELEDSFGCHVDLITNGMSDKHFLKNISGDCLVIYETHDQ